MFLSSKFNFIPNKIPSTMQMDEVHFDKNELGAYNACLSEPDFAVICGFLHLFSPQLQPLTMPTFRQLQEWVSHTGEALPGLRNFLVQLFLKSGKCVRRTFDQELLDFCNSYSPQDAQILKIGGFEAFDIAQKLRLIKELLESLMSTNKILQQYIATRNSTQLHDQPLGRDRKQYYYALCPNSIGVWSIYRRESRTGRKQLIATKRQHVIQLISQLGGDDYAASLSDSGIADEESNSNNSSNNLSLLTQHEQQLIIFLSALSASFFID